MRITPKSRAVWRAWLERHHAMRSEVWVVFYKRHTGKPTLSYADAVEEALCFGWIDGIRRSIDAARYMHRFSPRRPDSRWSATNRRRAARLAKSGAMTPAGQRAIDAARRNGTWSVPPPTVDLSMPSELAEGLRGNAAAAAFFDSLAPSYQRQFVGWIAMARREETRQRRVAKAIELLERGEKLGMV